jgi:hypothetical protein
MANPGAEDGKGVLRWAAVSLLHFFNFWHLSTCLLSVGSYCRSGKGLQPIATSCSQVQHHCVEACLSHSSARVEPGTWRCRTNVPPWRACCAGRCLRACNRRSPQPSPAVPIPMPNVSSVACAEAWVRGRTVA